MVARLPNWQRGLGSMMPPSELVLARYAAAGASDMDGLEVRWGRRAGDALPVWLVNVVLPDGLALAGAPDEWRALIESAGRHAAGVPSWARAVDVGVEGRSLVLAYAPLTGTPLSELRAPGLALERALDVVVALADALSTLHDQGLAHGLLRPDLVALDVDGSVRVAGLGVAELLARFGAGATLAAAAPAAFRAPEHGAGARLDPALDVFAFVGIVTELVAGRRPSTALETPRAFGVDLGDGFEAALGRALATDPRARPLDLRHFARELAELARSPVRAAVSNVDAARSPPAGPPALDFTPVPIPAPRGAPPPASAPPREPSWSSVLLVVLPIVLGVLALVGGATAVAVLAVREARSPSAGAGSAAPGTPHAAAPAPPRTGGPSGHGHGSAESAAEPPPRPQPVPSPRGERARPLEAHAFLPVSPEQPIWGTPDALATVAVLGDLECAPTRSALRSALRVQAELGAAVRFVFYHAPEPTHPHAREAARMLAQASLRHGPDVAWRLLAEIAESRSPATSEQFTRWLGAAGLPGAPSIVADSRAALDRLDEDAKLGILLDVRATPTLFVNGARVEGAPDEALLRRRIEEESRAVRWLRAEGVSAEEAYARRVRRNLVNIDAGAVDRACIPDDGAPIDGPPDALVTLVEFSDFECPHCREVQPALRAVLARHRATVRRAWRSFALPQHERARRVAGFAMAARAAGGDRAFWELHDALFAGAAGFEDAELSALAAGLGLNGEALLAAADDPRTAVDLRTDEALAADLELAGTPTLFVNGRRLSGAVPEQVLEAVVEEELAAARRVVRRGVAPSGLPGLLCGAARTP